MQPSVTKSPMATVSRLVPPRAAQLLGECQNIAKDRFPPLLKLLFDKADDTFFELANKADSSQRQQTYFDAMRELRLKRPQVEGEFFKNLQNAYDACALASNVKLRATGSPEIRAELTLVDDREIEESLAITNFSESIKTRCKNELFGLDQRVGHLISDPELAKHPNPFGPESLGHALKEAIHHIDVDMEARLALFKMADRTMGPGLSELYRSLNEFLIREEILPKLTSASRSDGIRSDTTTKSRVIIETALGTEEATGRDVFSALSQLMNARATAGPAYGIGRGGPQAPQSGIAGSGSVGGHSGLMSNASGNPGAIGHNMLAPVPGFPELDFAFESEFEIGLASPLPTANILSNLTGLQQGQGPAAFMIDPSMFQNRGGNVLRSLRDSGAIGVLNQTDTLTLDIVTLIFDYILDDPAIPDAIKALIGRLQIPLLKVALIDKELFSKKTHPARQLLDSLAQAATGWSEGTRAGDALFEKLQYVVYRIVEEFDKDLTIFGQLLAELNAFLIEDARNAQTQADLAAKSLHTKEKIVLAKIAVDEAVKTRMANQDTREFVRQFIVDYWRQQLIVTHVEAGPDSDIWHSQLSVIDELMWSVAPKTTPEERRELTTRLPLLLKAVKSGMRELEMEPAVCSKFLTMLASVHVVSVKQIEEASLAERRLSHREESTQSEIAESSQSEAEFVKKALDRLMAKNVVAEEVLDIDLSAFEAEAETVESEPDLEHDADGPLMERIMELDLGDWLEFTKPDEPLIRARFTWISETTGRYLFTDRKGRKALDLTLGALIERFRTDSVRLIETQPDPLFERAIGELMDRLEQPQAS
jgi:Protein of unknown function (DUF1631)